MNDKVSRILSIEQQLMALNKAEKMFLAHPVNRDFFNAHYRLLKRKRGELAAELSSEERTILQRTIRKARRETAGLIIGGPVAGTAKNGKPFAFIPTGPLLELRAR